MLYPWIALHHSYCAAQKEEHVGSVGFFASLNFLFILFLYFKKSSRVWLGAVIPPKGSCLTRHILQPGVPHAISLGTVPGNRYKAACNPPPPPFLTKWDLGGKKNQILFVGAVKRWQQCMLFSSRCNCLHLPSVLCSFQLFGILALYLLSTASAGNAVSPGFINLYFQNQVLREICLLSPMYNWHPN